MKYAVLIFFTVSSCAYMPSCVNDCYTGDIVPSPLIGSEQDLPFREGS